MTEKTKKLGVTEVVLRDAHQSLFATRLRLDDMLPIAEKIDNIGYWSVETWGGATFDSCIRYLGEDPWERIRELKKAMPKTPHQMLFRGQNILGYRHYADDVVTKFVERAALNGVDIFRVFDAMNDMRNIETALRAVKTMGKHAQGTISYTLSPVHTLEKWVEQGKTIEDMGADSIVIKDMAGLLKPYVGYELVKQLKAACDIPIHLHCHATTGLAHATLVKCVEAGVDNVDTAISSMATTYGHSPTETLVATFEGEPRDTGLDLTALQDVALYFRDVRKKYAKFEGSLKGVDARILIAQVPGGMLTNMESQLKEQGAEDKFDEVLEEIPRVRKDLGYLPLVTPTSQIVGTQAVINVMTGERFSNISKEVAGVLRGEYGATPAPVDKTLQARVLKDGQQVITCRPADLLEPELEALTQTLKKEAEQKEISLSQGENEIDDVLTYALYPQIGLKFLANRGKPNLFEPVPTEHEFESTRTNNGDEVYTVTVDSEVFTVTVGNGGDLTGIVSLTECGALNFTSSVVRSGAAKQKTNYSKSTGEPVTSPLAGNIFRVLVAPGDEVEEGDTLIVLEAMKMETQISAANSGTVDAVNINEGDVVAVGDVLLIVSAHP